jgi:hypothetical protein
VGLRAGLDAVAKKKSHTSVFTYEAYFLTHLAGHVIDATLCLLYLKIAVSACFHNDVAVVAFEYLVCKFLAFKNGLQYLTVCKF